MVVTQSSDPRTLAFLENAGDRLEALTTDLTTLTRQQSEQRRELKTRQGQLDEWCAEEAQSIALAPKGEFPNAEARGTELKLRTRRDAHAKAIQHGIDQQEHKLAETSVQLDEANRKRQDLHALMGFTSNWLRYYATEPA